MRRRKKLGKRAAVVGKPWDSTFSGVRGVAAVTTDLKCGVLLALDMKRQPSGTGATSRLRLNAVTPVMSSNLRPRKIP